MLRKLVSDVFLVVGSVTLVLGAFGILLTFVVPGLCFGLCGGEVPYPYSGYVITFSGVPVLLAGIILARSEAPTLRPI